MHAELFHVAGAIPRYLNGQELGEAGNSDWRDCLLCRPLEVARGIAAKSHFFRNDLRADFCRHVSNTHRKLVLSEIPKKNGIWQNAGQPAIRKGSTPRVRIPLATPYHLR